MLDNGELLLTPRSGDQSCLKIFGQAGVSKNIYHKLLFTDVFGDRLARFRCRDLLCPPRFGGAGRLKGHLGIFRLIGPHR